MWGRGHGWQRKATGGKPLRIPIQFVYTSTSTRRTESFLPPHFLCHNEPRLLKTMNLNDVFLKLRCSKKDRYQKAQRKTSCHKCWFTCNSSQVNRSLSIRGVSCLVTARLITQIKSEFDFDLVSINMIEQ